MGIPQRLKNTFFSGKNMCKAIIGIFFTLSLIIGISYQSQLVGEWPSYALVTVSFINDGNPTISREDVIKAKELLPEWSQYMDFDHLSVSPYFYFWRRCDIMVFLYIFIGLCSSYASTSSVAHTINYNLCPH